MAFTPEQLKNVFDAAEEYKNDLTQFVKIIKPPTKIYPWQEELMEKVHKSMVSRFSLNLQPSDGKSGVETATRERIRQELLITGKATYSIIIDDPIKDVTVDE